jgi:hypothetical protein
MSDLILHQQVSVRHDCGELGASAFPTTRLRDRVTRAVGCGNNMQVVRHDVT